MALSDEILPGPLWIILGVFLWIFIELASKELDEWMTIDSTDEEYIRGYDNEGERCCCWACFIGFVVFPVISLLIGWKNFMFAGACYATGKFFQKICRRPRTA